MVFISLYIKDVIKDINRPGHAAKCEYAKGNIEQHIRAIQLTGKQGRRKCDEILGPLAGTQELDIGGRIT